MKNDYLNIDNTDYRIEYNWLAIENFLEDEPDISTLDQMDVLAKLSPKQFRKLTFLAMVEGAECENTTFPFNEKEFARKLSVGILSQLIMVYAAQTNPETSGGPEIKKKRAKILNR